MSSIYPRKDLKEDGAMEGSVAQGSENQGRG